MAHDDTFIADLITHIDASDKRTLNLSELRFPADTDMAFVLQVIVNRAPRLKSARFAFHKTAKDRDLLEFLIQSRRFALANGVCLLEIVSEIDLKDAKVSDDGILPLALAAEAGQIPQLQSIILNGTNVTDASFLPLARAAETGQIPQLQQLDLCNTLVTDASFLPLARAAEAGCVTQLQSLDLNDTTVTNASILPLARAAESGQMPHLQRLCLNVTQIADNTIIPLTRAAEAGQIPRLKWLNLEGTQITDNAILPLARAAESGQIPQLQLLSLSDTLVKDIAFLPFARAVEAGKIPKLHSLYLNNTHVTDDGFLPFARAAEAGKIPRLHSLSLGGQQLTDDSFLPVARAAESGQIRDLRRLSLRGTRVSDQAILLLVRAAESGQIPHLAWLHLGGQQITDDSILPLAHAADAGKVALLRGLDLRGTRVTDRPILILARAAEAGQIPKFFALLLSGTQVTASIAVLISLRARSIFRWYLDREDSRGQARILPEIKLLILGQGGVGKSVLCQRVFLSRSSDQHIPSQERQETHGFDMHNVQLSSEMELPDGLDSLALRVWDFGGQNELHSTHRLFVGAERAFYILVLDASRNSRANKLTYWLRFVAQHGTPDTGTSRMPAPALIVLTQYDRVRLAERQEIPKAESILADHAELLQSIDEAKKQGYFGANIVDTIDECAFPDAKTNAYLFGDLRDQLQDDCREACAKIRGAVACHLKSVIKLFDPVVPADLAVRDWILNRFQPADNLIPWIKFRWDDPALKEWCQERELDGDGEKGAYENRVKNALRLMQSLGLVHWIGDHLDRYRRDPDDPMRFRVLNPRWVEPPMYSVVRAEELELPCGWITQEQIRESLLPDRHTGMTIGDPLPNDNRKLFEQLPFGPEDRREVLQLMKESNLIFAVTNGKREEGWIIPDRLIDWPGSESRGTERYRYEISFLPDRVLLQFLGQHIAKAFEEARCGTTDVIQKLRTNVHRNRAVLPWKLPGHTEEMTVEIQCETCPPADSDPWIAIGVTGGNETTREMARLEVVVQLNAILSAEGLDRLPLHAPINVETFGDQSSLDDFIELGSNPERTFRRLLLFYEVGVEIQRANGLSLSMRDIATKLTQRQTQIGVGCTLARVSDACNDLLDVFRARFAQANEKLFVEEKGAYRGFTRLGWLSWELTRRVLRHFRRIA